MSFLDAPPPASPAKVWFLNVSAFWILIAALAIAPTLLVTFAACGMACDEVAPLLYIGMYGVPVALAVSIILIIFAWRRKAPLPLLLLAGLLDLLLAAMAVRLYLFLSGAF